MQRLFKLHVVCLLLASAVPTPADEAGRYMQTSDYLDSAFPSGQPDVSTVWLTGELRDAVEDALGHRYDALRVRYWYDGATSAWVLDEIGKEMPITIGVTIRDDSIRNIQVLEFRESRGWEVRYPFFTDQFRDARMDTQGELDRAIDGITGATLSVGAMTRVAKAALVLHANIKQQG